MSRRRKTLSDSDRLAVPPVGGTVLFTTFCTVVVFFAGVAVFNLMHGAALSAPVIGGSVLWLLIVAAWLVATLAEAGGIRQLMVSLAGIFARRAFVEIQRQPMGPPVFRYGFELFGRSFSYDPIEITRIGMVNWHPGQASGMRGRDCNDWSVAVWYEHGSGAAWDGGDLRDKRIRVVTPCLPKQAADATGRSVVALLRAAGVSLVSTGEAGAAGREFTVERTGTLVP